MKVAIIGGGITGLYLAWKLAEKGEEVTIFEKKERIGKEVCSGLFSQRILEFIPESQKLIQNQLNYCLIHFPKRTLRIKFSTPKEILRLPTGQGKFFVMSHAELDRLVASLAQKSGTKILLNQNLTGKDLVKLKVDRIIGCDGAMSQVRQFLDLKHPQFYLGIQGFVPDPPPKFGGGASYVETWPTKNGFLWKIPRGKETEYGIIEKPEKAKEIFADFLKKQDIVIEKLNSALIPQGLIIPKNQKITLCGDAAGLTKPWSGGGVIWGLLASEILIRNFPDFLKYQKEIKKFFLPKIIFSKLAKKLVYFLGFNFPRFLPNNFKIEGDFLI